MAFKRSEVRSRLSPPTRESEKRLETSISSLFLFSGGFFEFWRLYFLSAGFHFYLCAKGVCGADFNAFFSGRGAHALRGLSFGFFRGRKAAKRQAKNAVKTKKKCGGK